MAPKKSYGVCPQAVRSVATSYHAVLGANLPAVAVSQIRDIDIFTGERFSPVLPLLGELVLHRLTEKRRTPFRSRKGADTMRSAISTPMRFTASLFSSRYVWLMAR